ncbi:MAG: YicC/YloC family endoribonuclease [Moorellales bacterium]
MPLSMTGFGAGEAENSKFKVRIEIRAVNHRFLEINVRLPRPYLLWEERIREVVARFVHRGHLDIYVNLEQERAKKRQIKVDKDLLMAYYEYLREIAQFLDIPAEIALRDVMALPGVLEVGEEPADPEGAWPVTAEALEAALRQVVAARTREGRRLAADLRDRLHRLYTYLEEIDCQREAILTHYRQRLSSRLTELLGDGRLDDRRLEEEVVLFAERSDVTEELVRLRSHLAEMLACLDADGPVGRRLEFLAQEVHRELTTLGNKAASTGITPLVLASKEELEKVREQVQNLE